MGKAYGQAIFVVSNSIHSINEQVRFTLKSESKINCSFQYDAGEIPEDAVFDRAIGEGRKPPKQQKSPSQPKAYWEGDLGGGETNLLWQQFVIEAFNESSLPTICYDNPT